MSKNGKKVVYPRTDWEVVETKEFKDSENVRLSYYNAGLLVSKIVKQACVCLYKDRKQKIYRYLVYVSDVESGTAFIDHLVLSQHEIKKRLTPNPF